MKDLVLDNHIFAKPIRMSMENRLDISVIGKRCPREVYLYSLGLQPLITQEIAFIHEDNRIHKEAIIKYLEEAGFEISDKQLEIGTIDEYIYGQIDGTIHCNGSTKALNAIEAVSEYSFEGFSLYNLKEYRPEYYYKVQVAMHLLELKCCELRIKNKNTGAIELLFIDYNKGDALAALDFVRKLRDGYVPEVPDFEKYLEKYNNELISKWEQRVARFNKGELNQQYPPKKPTLLSSPSEAREKFCKHCLMAEHCTKKGELNG